MTLEDMKRKTYSLIEEYNEEADNLTDDEDLATKMNDVINQIQNECARIKKINAKKDLSVTEGEEMTLSDIDKDLYQLSNIRGVDYDSVGDTIMFNETGTAKVYYTKYPTQIDAETEDDFVFDLSRDILEVMPYGIAGDLLKNDPSNQYGAIYTARYRQMLDELDVRNATAIVSFDEGISV